MSYRNETHSKRANKGGFTLPEILITLGLMGLVSAATVSITYFCTRSMFTSEQKLIINKNIRDVTNEMIGNARQSNEFILYNSFDAAMRTATTTEEGIVFEMQKGQTGDFLVLIFRGEDPLPSDAVPPPITRLIGYYRSSNADDSKGPVYKFDIDIPAANQNSVVTQLIPSVASTPQHDVIVELSEGLANGQLFYNLSDTSVMVNAQFYSGNEAKWVTDTYNFTISPRG